MRRAIVATADRRTKRIVSRYAAAQRYPLRMAAQRRGSSPSSSSSSSSSSSPKPSSSSGSMFPSPPFSLSSSSSSSSSSSPGPTPADRPRVDASEIRGGIGDHDRRRHHPPSTPRGARSSTPLAPRSRRGSRQACWQPKTSNDSSHSHRGPMRRGTRYVNPDRGFEPTSTGPPLTAVKRNGQFAPTIKPAATEASVASRQDS